MNHLDFLDTAEKLIVTTDWDEKEIEERENNLLSWAKGTWG